MAKFLCKFNGRRNGAIGKFYNFSVIVEAETSEEANNKLYDTHEHISNLKITKK